MYFSLIFNSQKDNLGLYWLHSSCKNSCENHPSTSQKFFKSSHQLFCISRKRSDKIFTTGSLRLTKERTSQDKEGKRGGVRWRVLLFSHAWWEKNDNCKVVCRKWLFLSCWARNLFSLWEEVHSLLYCCWQRSLLSSRGRLLIATVYLIITLWEIFLPSDKRQITTLFLANMKIQSTTSSSNQLHLVDHSLSSEKHLLHWGIQVILVTG